MSKIKIGNKTPKFPIIQGGMGIGVSLHKLAGTVAREGGIGVISTANIGFRESDFYTNPLEANLRALKKEIRMARGIGGDGILGANVMVAASEYESIILECVANNIDLIISGAGLPLKLPKLVKGTKTKIAPIVSSVRALQIILKSWIGRYDYIPDLVIVEGPLAGGHLGFKYEELSNQKPNLKDIILDVLSIVQQIEDEYGRKIPIIAAGGIFYPEDVSSFIELGAAGVQIATRFVATHECDAAPEFKQAYIDSEEKDIQIINSPVGMPGRAIHNDFIERVTKGREKITKCNKCLKHCHIDKAPYCITKALVNSVEGNVSDGLIFCGSNTPRIKTLQSVRELLNELCSSVPLSKYLH